MTGKFIHDKLAYPASRDKVIGGFDRGRQGTH
jgi:hypothetical protein